MHVSKNQKVTFDFILAIKYDFGSFLTWLHCLMNETDNHMN